MTGRSPAIPGLLLRPAATADWDAIASALTRSHAADGVDEVATGAQMAAEWAPLDHFDLGRDVLLAELDGEVVGFIFGYRLLRDGTLTGETWGALAPEARRRGIGTALWQATYDRLSADLAADQRPGPRELRTYALDTEPGDIGLLVAHGYVPIRFGFEMRRFLTGRLPKHPLPEGLELRPVTPDQHRAIFDANNEAFEDHPGHRERGEGDFVARFSSPDTDTSLWCVAWDRDEVAGVVMNEINRAENATLGVRRGWLDNVSVRRPWRGLGVAKALCTASFRVLRDRGMDEAWLGVDAGNPTGALRLYEGLGFRVARQWRAYARPLDRPAPAGWQAGQG